MRFSEFFGINRSQSELDFVDVPLDTDIEVFLDPAAIKLLNSSWGLELASHLQNYFETVLKLIMSGDDLQAQRLLSCLNERNEYHLGYSSGKSRGHGFGEGSAKTVWGALTKSKAAKTGLLQDLEDTALLIEGIGTDMISDAVSNILRGPLIKYTQDVCNYYNIPLTDNIPSGPIWNPRDEKWEQGFVSLPVTNEGKVILVPKIIVRHRITYNHDEYYRHFLLPEMQRKHLSSGSELIELLKNGKERVTKKALMEKYGKDKLAIVEQTLKNPKILDEYRDRKREAPSPPLPHSDFSEMENESPIIDFKPFISELSSINPGRDDATKYENLIEKLFSIIFYPSFCHPTKQHRIHDGRKRIDISYSNEAQYGFFKWVGLHYPASMIFVECKNYGKEIGNPELDQLAGRFSMSRGKVGILVCRSIENKQKLYESCKDTAKDDRGFILPLDDEDILNLIEEYQTKNDQLFPSLRKLWLDLIN
ncbi:hypothetical protein [Serratia marcescens]|uniref:hypothetical protein n=1 Tax=Serratia TaxID=613 RepID=UPI00141C322F|nr:hypothetical protein [Serratia marcescens]EIJ7464821.1 hypothetical protein [Serratia marcescens]EJA2549226.1 hypothetical protein [Serratia marcescens]EJA2594287.1 hypothetical protein [Serratia marcescens]CAB1219534.1 hypothetical protein FB6_2610 [Serratia marcescens]